MSNIKKIGILKNSDIAALRYADNITFHSTSLEVPICVVTCNKDDRAYEFVLPAKKEDISIHVPGIEAIEAKINFKQCNLDWQLQSVFGLLKEFDELEIVWLPNTQALLYEEYSLVHDEIKVIIYRKNKRLHFVLASFVDNLEDSMFKFQRVKGFTIK